MSRQNPLSDSDEDDIEDRRLVTEAQAGSRDALTALVARHQRWIYNIVRRMVYVPQDAEDTTQEILIKLMTKLATYEGRARFRTWLYRIVVNHVLNLKRRAWEETGLDFAKYAASLDATPDIDLPDPRAVPVDVQLLVDEARIGCTTGMLLCLDREQRLTYVLGAIFGVSDRVGAELLDVSRDAFRQRLTRARRDLQAFMQGQCGLVNLANPCRCAKKTQGFAKAGYLDPQKLVFASRQVVRVRDVAPRRSDELDALDRAYAEIHRNHPFFESTDFVRTLKDFVTRSEFRSTLELD
ncbi:MAG: RNA polymerase sigma factor [Vicinamibacterales bacterium]